MSFFSLSSRRRRLDFFYSFLLLSLSSSIRSSFLNAMGRHNGGTRSKGGNLTVGAALTNKQKGKSRPGAPKGSTDPTSHHHTTEAPASSGLLQSMLNASDLGELMDVVSSTVSQLFLSVAFSWYRSSASRRKKGNEAARYRGRGP